MAGTAELSGYSRALNTIRCDNMTQLARELFPTALDFDNVCYWSGLRPTTPSNVPLIGRTKIQNLYLNTGHGTLGWTMGVGRSEEHTSELPSILRITYAVFCLNKKQSTK